MIWNPETMFTENSDELRKVIEIHTGPISERDWWLIKFGWTSKGSFDRDTTIVRLGEHTIARIKEHLPATQTAKLQKGELPDQFYNAQFEFKLEDLWIGAFWKRTGNAWDLWVCIIPCFPLHISWGFKHSDQ